MSAVPSQPAISSAHAPDASGAASRVLRIVAGLHAGASRALAEQEMLVVGSGDDCDIVLADTGVAAHHALITLVGGGFTLRALDAPLRVEGKPLHPGDPVEVRPLQRIDLGEAAIAFGPDDNAAWDALFPAIAAEKKRTARPLLRRLPLIAATAVLILAAVAVVAAFLPRGNDQVDAQAFLQALVSQHQVAQAQINTDANGALVLSGTVESDAMRQEIQQQLQQAGVGASLELRTGEGLARAVQEEFRIAGVNVSTRYLGNGEVEVDGALDRTRFEEVAASRSMRDSVAQAKLVPGPRLAGAPAGAAGRQGDAAAAPPEPPPVDIVSVVRGAEPYVVDSDGQQYAVGDRIPGHGTLIAIGSKIYVKGANGEIRQIRPVTAAELAARAAAAEGASFENVTGSTDLLRTSSTHDVDPASDKLPAKTATTRQ